MSYDKGLHTLISYLTAGTPASATFTNILKQNSAALLTAMEEIIKNNGTETGKKIPKKIISSSNTVLKNIFKTISSQDTKKAISLLFALSEDKEAITNNLKTILLNEDISDSIKEETLEQQLQEMSLSASLLFLVNIYQKSESDIKYTIRDKIYQHLKNPKHSLKSIRNALSIVWKDFDINTKTGIILFRGIDKLSGFKRDFKKDLLYTLSKNNYGYGFIRNNPGIADLIFSFHDDNLSWLFIAESRRESYFDGLLSYIAAHDTKETSSRLLELLVKNGKDVHFSLWEKLLFAFSQFDAQQLLPYIDHPDGEIQKKILRLLASMKNISWKDPSLKNTIRKKLKSPSSDIRNITIEILEKYEHQKTLLPVLSIINRGNKEEIDALDLSILDQNKNSHPIPFDKNLFAETVGRFPFTLTKDQHSATKEIIQDMGSKERMYRLLQGDVASGKTEVVLLSMAQVIKEKKQCVLLCPTQILANQQFERCKKFFSVDTRVALLTGNSSSKEKQKIFSEIKEGTIDVLIGTHSILQENIDFKDLALSVIDEQQKFGVIQRSKILKQNCHALEISATPIPRSLSLRNHGLIDITSIKQVPKGRKHPKTSVIHSGKRNALIEDIKERLTLGEQVYRVCKTISSSNYKSVDDVYNELRREFSSYKIAIIHGNKQASINQAILQQFIQGNIDILVSTTMIESGLDIPNAKSIVIENAESYGLSQLHQMRGRVSRDTRQGFCYLCTDVLRKETIRKDFSFQRDVFYYILDTTNKKQEHSSRQKNITLETQQKKIETLLKCFDGYEIAEIDLQLSGGGEIKGTRQRGNF